MLPITMINWIPNYLSNMPLHLQLAKSVKQRIINQTLRYGQILPATKDIGIRLGISAQIIKSAYIELQNESLGLLQNNGTFAITIKTQVMKINTLHS
ncbi:GntR family transcriptional regulator [Mucilaginibacter terrae]|uniref:DNA-binding transcriptional regulator YhcF (GntR family) n=1 Tax=Mucilaginibacter terrae TaxID=1955052 RepID=A0ABU3GQF4_9SPHI|nr:GntR family transcriptional regulator [Mucilaginibacter terrae]MDT3401997.1 DNA-binding transcriptional regulator YhcF (GntR family) [Mucilaginibacter terrae]